MRVVLDENLCEVEADSVAEAVAAAASVAHSRGRMIVEVLVDGRQWNSERLESNDANAGAEEVRLVSADVDELLKQALDDAASALQDADELQRQAAELLQCGNTSQAMHKLGDAVSIWMSVQQAVSMVIEWRRDRQGGAAVLDEYAVPAIEQLNARLCEVRDALQRSDSVALSDSLLYDLPQVVTQWRQLLSRLTSKVEGS